MGARIVTTRKEPNGLEPPGIRGIENRQAIAEHVTDIKMAPIRHDLHAVGTAANIAVGQMTDLMPDPLRRNWSILRGARGLRQQRQCCQSNQGFQMFAAGHRHFSLVMRPFLSSSSKEAGAPVVSYTRSFTPGLGRNLYFPVCLVG